MVLIEVVQAIVHLGVVDVDIRREGDLAGKARAARALAELIVADGELVEIVGLLVKEVGEPAEENEEEADEAEAAAKIRRYQLMRHHVVQGPLLVLRQVVFNSDRNQKS